VWWEIRADDHVCRLLVEAHDDFTLRTMDRLAYLKRTRLRRMGDPMVLVVAPWLSPRCRELIDERGWSYLDLSGNVLLKNYRPAIYVRQAGAETDPRPRGPGEVLLSGSKVNGLVRLLADVTPPYRVGQLASATGLSHSYVSRATRTMHDQGLVDRLGTGPVTAVNWAELLRQRARVYDVLTDNGSQGFVTTGDPRDLMARLGDDVDAVVTGAFATGREDADQLALYVPDLRAFARAFDLRPARGDANVLLLEPSSRSQVKRCRIVGGVRLVGYSQLAQDLLCGDDQNRTLGEEVLEQMAATTEWRLPHLPDLNNPDESKSSAIQFAASA
jgi:hypothetical protein